MQNLERCSMPIISGYTNHRHNSAYGANYLMHRTGYSEVVGPTMHKLYENKDAQKYAQYFGDQVPWDSEVNNKYQWYCKYYEPGCCAHPERVCELNVP